MGGFDTGAVVEGRTAMLNLWDHELSLENVEALSCSSQGNLLTMSNMSIGGPASFTTEDVPCETGKLSIHGTSNTNTH